MNFIKNKLQSLVVIFYLILSAFWFYLLVTGHKEGDLNFTYSFLFGLIPLIGGIIGLFKSRIWGGLKSTLGRGIFFVSLGLFWWGFGESIWSYYNFFKNVAAPYPSLADIGFAQSVFFWVIGSIFLASASGAFLLIKKSKTAKVSVFIIPLFLAAACYYLLVTVARGGVIVPEGESMLKVVLDIAYPLSDFLAATFACLGLILSSKYLGGYYRSAIFAVFTGLGVMFFADFVFSWTTTKGTFYNADWGDLMLSTGLFLMTFGILGFASRPQLRSKSVEKKSDEQVEDNK